MFHNPPFVSTGSTSVDSTNHRWKICTVALPIHWFPSLVVWINTCETHRYGRLTVSIPAGLSPSGDTMMKYLTGLLIHNRSFFVSRGSKFQHRGTSKFVVWWKFTFCFIDGTFLLCPWVVKRANKLPQASFIRTLILFTKALP